MLFTIYLLLSALSSGSPSRHTHLFCSHWDFVLRDSPLSFTPQISLLLPSTACTPHCFPWSAEPSENQICFLNAHLQKLSPVQLVTLYLLWAKLLGSCLYLSQLGVLVLWWNTMTKATCRVKGVFNPQHCSSLKEVGTGTHTGQEPGGRSWCRSHGGMLLTGLLIMACSACFLIEPRTTSPRMASPTMGWALPNQSLIKKMPYSLACSPILWRHVLNWSSLLSDDSSLCKVGIKLASIINIFYKAPYWFFARFTSSNPTHPHGHPLPLQSPPQTNQIKQEHQNNIKIFKNSKEAIWPWKLQCVRVCLSHSVTPLPKQLYLQMLIAMNHSSVSRPLTSATQSTLNPHRDSS
jgi:hypothetical protein